MSRPWPPARPTAWSTCCPSRSATTTRARPTPRWMPLGLARDFGDQRRGDRRSERQLLDLAPMFPAGLSADVTGFSPDSVPLASVGALNLTARPWPSTPNDGDWVSTFRTGRLAGQHAPCRRHGIRAGLGSGSTSPVGRARPKDPDDYRGGFAAWAAPASPGRSSPARSRPPWPATPTSPPSTRPPLWQVGAPCSVRSPSGRARNDTLRTTTLADRAAAAVRGIPRGDRERID